MFQLALLKLHNFYKTLWPKCHIQWLYLAAHGCKTYLNLNLTTVALIGPALLAAEWRHCALAAREGSA
jgi:hypothetical protein